MNIISMLNTWCCPACRRAAPRRVALIVVASRWLFSAELCDLCSLRRSIIHQCQSIYGSQLSMTTRRNSAFRTTHTPHIHTHTQKTRRFTW